MAGDVRACGEADGTEARSHVTTLHHECGVDCHLVGVCHLSARSIEEARRSVEELRPAVVCVELCDERAELLEPGWGAAAGVLPPLCCATFCEHWHWLLHPLFWAVQLQCLALEALLGTRMGMEQAAAASAARSLGVPVLLADRRQSITLGRTLVALADPGVLREVLGTLYRDRASVSGLVREVAELELLVLSPELKGEEFARASGLARRVVDRLLDSAGDVGTLGSAGKPIQEERDYLLSHSLFHCCSAVPPGGRVVAVLGAAHLEGVARNFTTFASEGCTAERCGVEARVRALHEVSKGPIYALAGALLFISGAGYAGRWALMRHFRRTRGVAWARRANAASVILAAGLGAFGLCRASWQYEAVRQLQLHSASCTPHAGISNGTGTAPGAGVSAAM